MRALYKILRACISIFVIKTAAGLQYRFAAFASAVAPVFYSLVEISIYTVFYTYADRPDAGLAAGMTLAQVVTYTWFHQAFLPLSIGSAESELITKITNGDVGIELCRPMDLYWHWFSRTVSSRLSPPLIHGSLVILAGNLAPGGYRLSPPASLTQLLCMAAMLCLSLLLSASFMMICYMIRFHIAWGEGPMGVIVIASQILSGAYVPLRFFPGFMQKFLMAQPFAGLLDIPLRFYLGLIPARELPSALFLQLFWIVSLIALGKLLMRRGLKKLIVQGG